MFFIDDFLKVFFMIGEDIYNEEDKSVEVDLTRRSHFGSSIITLTSRVEDEPERLLRSSGLRSRLLTPTSERPRASGEVRCVGVRPPASARAVMGFLPAITGYNGDTGLSGPVLSRIVKSDQTLNTLYIQFWKMRQILNISNS